MPEFCAWCDAAASSSHLEDDGGSGVRIHECAVCAMPDAAPLRERYQGPTGESVPLFQFPSTMPGQLAMPDAGS